MNQIKFKRVAVEGYRSYLQPVSFDLDRSGVNLIRGLNGAGKTSLFEAMVWAIYKMTLKGQSVNKVASWKRLRTKDWRGTRAVVEFADAQYDYKVARHVDFKGTTHGLTPKSGLLIFRKPVGEERPFEQDDLLGDEQHKKDQEAYLIDVIGVDGKAFVSSILFGQRMSRLVESDNEDKRKIFDQLFDLDFVEGAKEKAKKKYDEESAELTTINTKIAQLEISLTNGKERYERELKLKTDWEEEQLKQKNQLETDISETALNIQDIEKEQAEADRVLAEFVIEGKDELERQELDLYTKNGNLKASMEEKLKDKKRAVTKKIEENDAAIKAAKEALKDVDTYDTVKAAKEELTKAEQKVKEGDKVHADYTREKSRAEAKVKELEQQLAEVKTECPACKAPIKKEKVQEVKDNINRLLKAEQDVVTELGKKIVAQEKESGLLVKAEHKAATALTKAVDEAKAAEKVKQDALQSLKNKRTVLETEQDAIQNDPKDVEALAQGEKQYREVKQKLDGLKGKEEEKKQLEKKVSDLATELQVEKKALEGLNSALKRLGEATPPKLDLEAVKEANATLIDDINTHMQMADIKKAKIEKIKWWIDKGFAASGLKSFVFNAMLNRLNAYAEKYASRIGTRVKFSVDLSKASKPFTTTCYVAGEETDYEDFSGGERQRIDVCLAFAMFDLVGHKVNTNILIMDEIFEGLDPDGVEIAFDLIRAKADEGKAVYIVTHSQHIDSMYCKHISFEKSEGGTKIVS